MTSEETTVARHAIGTSHHPGPASGDGDTVVETTPPDGEANAWVSRSRSPTSPCLARTVALACRLDARSGARSLTGAVTGPETRDVMPAAANRDEHSWSRATQRLQGVRHPEHRTIPRPFVEEPVQHAAFVTRRNARRATAARRPRTRPHDVLARRHLRISASECQGTAAI